MTNYNYEAELKRWELLEQNKIRISMRNVETNITFKIQDSEVVPNYWESPKYGLTRPLDMSKFVQIKNEFYRLARDNEFMILLITKTNALKDNAWVDPVRGGEAHEKPEPPLEPRIETVVAGTEEPEEFPFAPEEDEPTPNLKRKKPKRHYAPNPLF